MHIRLRIPGGLKAGFLLKLRGALQRFRVLKLPGPKLATIFSKPWIKALVATLAVAFIAVSAAMIHQYIRYGKIVDERLRHPMFPHTARIYAAPGSILTGEKIGLKDIVAALRRAGYTAAGEPGESSLGTYRLHGSSIEIMPGAESYYRPGRVRVSFGEGKIEKMTSLEGPVRGELDHYELEPQLITSLYDEAQRAKRRLVTYDEIPKNLRDAIVAIEDRRFFDHGGVNYLRLAAVAVNDIRTGQYLHGAGGSTLTMQFAKGFFLTSDKTPTRKWAQILIALQLENRLSKQEILAAYVNWAPMGQRGSFEIAGMGEASQVYFGKDMKDLKLEECALLAAIVQRPSFLTPFRHPERALQRRNLVLDAMVETGAIRREEADRAKSTPLHLATADTDASDAPYFVDLVRDELLADYDEEQLDQDGMRIYTTIDPALQKAAAEAVRAGMSQVDELIRRQRTRKVKVGEGKDAHMETRTLPGPQAQVL